MESINRAQEPSAPVGAPPSRYEAQKRRDWNTFLQYLKNHKPPLSLHRCSGAHVLEFLKYLDQFGKTKVHIVGCAYFGHPNPPAPCPCPLKQAWGSLDALIGRLRAAYEENGGQPESNPFGARALRIYLREVREEQARARGIPYEKKKRKRHTTASHGGMPAPKSDADAGGSGSGTGGLSEEMFSTVHFYAEVIIFVSSSKSVIRSQEFWDLRSSRRSRKLSSIGCCRFFLDPLVQQWMNIVCSSFCVNGQVPALDLIRKMLEGKATCHFLILSGISLYTIKLTEKKMLTL